MSFHIHFALIKFCILVQIKLLWFVIFYVNFAGNNKLEQLLNV